MIQNSPVSKKRVSKGPGGMPVSPEFKMQGRRMQGRRMASSWRAS